MCVDMTLWWPQSSHSLRPPLHCRGTSCRYPPICHPPQHICRVRRSHLRVESLPLFWLTWQWQTWHQFTRGKLTYVVNWTWKNLGAVPSHLRVKWSDDVSKTQSRVGSVHDIGRLETHCHTSYQSRNEYPIFCWYVHHPSASSKVYNSQACTSEGFNKTDTVVTVAPSLLNFVCKSPDW